MLPWLWTCECRTSPDKQVKDVASDNVIFLAGVLCFSNTLPRKDHLPPTLWSFYHWAKYLLIFPDCLNGWFTTLLPFSGVFNLCYYNCLPAVVLCCFILLMDYSLAALSRNCWRMGNKFQFLKFFFRSTEMPFYNTEIITRLCAGVGGGYCVVVVFKNGNGQ